MKRLISFFSILTLLLLAQSAFSESCIQERSFCEGPFDQRVWDIRAIVDELEIIQSHSDDELLKEVSKICEQNIGGRIRTHRQFFLTKMLNRTETYSDDLKMVSHVISKTRSLVDAILATDSTDYLPQESLVLSSDQNKFAADLISPSSKDNYLRDLVDKAYKCVDHLVRIQK